MSWLGELTTLFENIPLWKRLKTLPSEVEALEKRVAVLEAALRVRGDDQCPRCHQGSFRLVRTELDPTFSERDTATCIRMLEL